MPLTSPLRILHLEDDPDYASLVTALLRRDGIAAEVVLVTNRVDYESAIYDDQFDLILADYLLPGYDGMEALKFAREHCPQTPFLLVSGTIGEHAAIETLKFGARDYVLKTSPERLVPSVTRALQESEEKAQRHRAELELVRQEKYFRALTENSLDMLGVLDRHGHFLYNSPSIFKSLGYEPSELIGVNLFALVHPDDLARTLAAFERALQNPLETVTVEGRIQHRDGSWRFLEIVGQNRLDDPEIKAVVINSRDVSDRRRAEEEVRESEEQYRLIFSSHPNPMWIVDVSSLHFLEVNDAAVQHYGYTRDEFRSMSTKDLHAPGEHDSLEHTIKALVDKQSPSGGTHSGTWRHCRKNGSVIDVEVTWNPIKFCGRAAYLAMATDVTERRRIEHRNSVFSKLGQSLSSASSAADAASTIQSVADHLFAWDAFTLDVYLAEADKIYALVNVDTDRQGKRYLVPSIGEGKPPSAMARRTIEHGGQLILRKEPLRAPVDSIPIGYEGRFSASLLVVPIRTRAGVIGILSVQSYTFKAYDEQDLHTLQTLADHCAGALERIRAEQALHQSEQRFRDLFEGSPDAIFVEDLSGVVLDVNPAACRLHCMERADLVGRHFSELVPGDQRSQAISRFPAFVDGSLRQLEGTSLTLDGKGVPVELRANRIEYGGKPALLFHVRDISAHRRLEEQLRQSQKMEAIGQLAGGVAHDFNNILTVIHGHGSLLMGSGSLAGSSARSAQQIVQAAERAAALTRQLLAFGRRQLMQARRLDMNEVVTNMTKMLGRILGEDIALQLQYHKQPAVVRADAGMMEQVLLNLAVNSRDAMPGGGVLVVGISVVEKGIAELVHHPHAHAGNYVCLTVTDNGCGIAPETLPRIFEPFFTTKEIGKGTGLGLATVYGIIRQHQGWIEVESRLEHGTTFRVYLPHGGAGADLPDDRSQELPARGGTETILVVEDEEPVRELVCHLLESNGYRILQAPSGIKALEIWEKSGASVDLVVTDLVMPDRLNGRELAEKLWADRPDLKVLFTSGYSADVVGKDFVLKKGLNYLQKPYHPQRLARAVRECLDSVN